MRLAIVADWLTTFGGAERVLDAMRGVYPDAPIFTTVARPDAIGSLAQGALHTTRLQRWYRLLRNHQLLLPLMPRALEEIDLKGYDVILTSSHAVAKGILPPPTARHVCYCHTPMRYAWEMEEDYLRDFRVPRIMQPWIRSQLKRLRRWDLSTAKRVDTFIANSTTTAERIRQTYGRESVILPPPVHERFYATTLGGSATHALERKGLLPGAYFLAVGRLVPYKRFDLLIATANALGLPLAIVGDGQDARRLRALAGPTVTFLGKVREEELPAVYAGARAVLFPQVEDAGIVPREALACGTPCIALGQGGVLDAVEDGVTGILFCEQTSDDLTSALRRFTEVSWDRAEIRRRARDFSEEGFRSSLRRIVECGA
ncbi:MAG: group 1 glycosyl transferase [Candidatus Peregrinibacteria bacterium Gr01-1014_25]|nr:MAG: group 1 glycosyl transferase [Candidatus Peregrinibacteria bacterium Gr01-1014_25]